VVPVLGTGLLVAGLMAVAGVSSEAHAVGLPGSTAYLGAAQSFAVLAGSTATNTGAPTHVWGDVGVSPGTAITGFLPNQIGGTSHAGDTAADDAQTSLTTAYLQAAALGPSGTDHYPQVGGLTLDPGVYNATSGMALTGKVTLDGHGDPNATWVFQAGTTLVTDSRSEVSVVNGNPCNVYWQVGSSATLGSGSTFIGTVMADQSITATTGAAVAGRLLAHSAAVTLDSNQITAPVCALTDASGAALPAPSASPTVTPTPTVTPSPSVTPSPTVTSSPTVTPSPTAAPTSTPGPSAAPTGSPTAAPSPTSAPTVGPGSTGQNGTLATTGSDFRPQLSLAVALLALGSLLLGAGPLRRAWLRRRTAAVGRE
jgi:type VI secretion system secreted protein VgrG